MPKTRIEWCDWTENPVKGLCPMACSYCYARAMYHRFKWDPRVRYIEPGFTIAELQKIPSGSKVFWGSTIELFHDVIPDLWRKDIFAIVRQFPELTHIFLTKLPENLPREWPDNCWVGVSVTNRSDAYKAKDFVSSVQASVKFLSLEPLLQKMDGWALGDIIRHVDWLIIGQQTPVRESTTPKLEWVSEIVQAADKAGTPVFLKDNLKPLLCVKANGHEYAPVWANGGHGTLRQEFPKGKAHAQ